MLQKNRITKTDLCAFRFSKKVDSKGISMVQWIYCGFLCFRSAGCRITCVLGHILALSARHPSRIPRIPLLYNEGRHQAKINNTNAIHHSVHPLKSDSFPVNIHAKYMPSEMRESRHIHLGKKSKDRMERRCQTDGFN